MLLLLVITKVMVVTIAEVVHVIYVSVKNEELIWINCASTPVSSMDI